MIAIPDVLRQHLDYTIWASTRLLDAAAQLTRDELSRDFGTSDRSVIGTLVHLFGADHIWLTRVRRHSPGGRPGPEYFELPVLREAWADVHRGWHDWAETINESDIAAELSYYDLRGNPWQTPVWQVVLQVVNHGTHHRGQVSGFLRSMEHVPPLLDLIAYYRGL
jgi:uncharacterized damage-inducible protein DinB